MKHKNCPFCGGAPYEASDGGVLFKISCAQAGGCGAEASPEVWNNRLDNKNETLEWNGGETYKMCDKAAQMECERLYPSLAGKKWLTRRIVSGDYDAQLCGNNISVVVSEVKTGASVMSEEKKEALKGVEKKPRDGKFFFAKAFDKDQGVQSKGHWFVLLFEQGTLVCGLKSKKGVQ